MCGCHDPGVFGHTECAAGGWVADWNGWIAPVRSGRNFWRGELIKWKARR